MDFHARGKPKKEHSIRNISFINMRGGMKSRLNKSNKKGILYKKWDNYSAAHCGILLFAVVVIIFKSSFELY